MACSDTADPQPLLLPLESLPVPLACIGTGDDPLLLAVNGRFRASFALPPGPLPRLSQWLALTYPLAEYRGRVLEQWHSAAAMALAGDLGSLQCRLVSAGGEQLEVLLQISRQDEQLLVGFQDVTARSRAEAELEEAQASLAQTALAITEAIPVGTYTMVMPPDRPVAYFSFLSERFLQLTGLDRARARQNPLEGFACVHPDDYDDWLRLNAEAFARKQPFKGECRVVLQGETRWISAESVPRDLPDGSTVWEGVLSDITERVLAQQQLQESEQRLRWLIDNLPIPATTAQTGEAEAAYTAVFCNRRFIETFGYRAAELGDLSHWMARAYPDPAYRSIVEARWDAALAEAAASGSAVTAGEFTVRCADGRDRDVLISAAHSDGRVVATLVDLSERKQAERDLAAARERERQLEEQQRLRLAQKLRTSLTAAAVAHEINQPLSAVLLQAKLARQRLTQLEPAGRPPGSTAPEADTTEGQRATAEGLGSRAEGLGATAEGLGALAHLLDSLGRDAERVVQVMGKMRSLLRNVQTEPQPVDLTNVVESALLFRMPALGDQGVTLHCEGLEQPCPIAGDADQLQVAVSNLLHNALEALEAIPPGQRRLEVLVTRRPGEVTLSVGDSGSGFLPGMLEQLPLATTKPDGTGLGLYVVRTTAENHGGQLHFGRSPLGGALVQLTLPVQDAPGLAAARDATTAAPAATATAAPAATPTAAPAAKPTAAPAEPPEGTAAHPRQPREGTDDAELQPEGKSSAGDSIHPLRPPAQDR